MQYKAYLKQGGGCDYTIGCGRTVINIEADSFELAKTKLNLIIMDEYSDGIMAIDSAELFEVSSVYTAPVADLIKTSKQLRESLDQEDEEKRQRAQYEELKKKFG